MDGTAVASKLTGLEQSVVENYMSEMRLCFTEAGAYLKYFDEIEDKETRAYILRSRANMSLGQFASPEEKIRRVRQTLQILQDKYYQEKEPDLPWDRYIFMVHRQMASSISFHKDNTMSAEDIEAIMESVYIVYQTRLQEADGRGEQPPIHSAFSYYAISYYCGLDTLEGLLTKMEQLMDRTDLSDFSAETCMASSLCLHFTVSILSSIQTGFPAAENISKACISASWIMWTLFRMRRRMRRSFYISGSCPSVLWRPSIVFLMALFW